MSGRILVVDDNPVNVRVLEAMLQAEYFDVLSAYDGAEAIEIAKRDQPDLILLDVMMPEIDGFEACRRLKADPLTRHIPVVMVTALDQREDRIRGLEAGADEFLTKPVQELTLFARVRSLLRLKTVLDELRYRDESSRMSGLIPDHGEEDEGLSMAIVVAGDVAVGQRIADSLPGHVQSHLETDPAAGVVAAGADEVDVVIVDLTSQRFDGLRLCARIRSDAKSRQVAILGIVEPDNIGLAVRALDIGVNDVLHRPIDKSEMSARVSTQLRRKRYADKLRTRLDEGLEMAVTDPLTRLHNRRYVDSRLRKALESANNGGAPVCLLLADIDYFKRINDTHGHDVGDEVLCEFATRMSDGLRALDIAARYGGEEFLIMMAGAGLSEARIAAERLRKHVGEKPFNGPNGAPLDVTVSIGIAQAKAGDTVETFLRRADEALYAAKRNGRNRTEAADEAAA